jgi:Domain of Unknown Function (DUF928)
MLQWLQQKWQKILALTLVMVLSSYLCFPLQPTAAANPVADFFQRIRTVFAPPSTSPAGRRKGGGGRGPLCPASRNALVKALMPPQSTSDSLSWTTRKRLPPNGSEFVWGRTTEEYPTVWFYVPYEAGTLKSAKLVVLDADKQLLPNYPLLINLTGTPGVMSVRFSYPLELKKQYAWYFSILCSTDKPSRNPSVRGWIQRVEPIAADTYQTYAENGIWYDSVTNLLSHYQNEPDRYKEDWLGLLEFLKAPELEDANIITSSQPTHMSPNNADVHTVDHSVTLAGHDATPRLYSPAPNEDKAGA